MLWRMPQKTVPYAVLYHVAQMLRWEGGLCKRFHYPVVGVSLTHVAWLICVGLECTNPCR